MAATATATAGRRTWTDELVLDALQRWCRDHAGAPRAVDWRKAAPGRPQVKVVIEMFGSWNAGLAAAGLEVRRPGRPAADVSLEVCDAIRGRYELGATCRQLAAEFGVDPTTIAARVRRAGGCLRRPGRRGVV